MVKLKFVVLLSTFIFFGCDAQQTTPIPPVNVATIFFESPLFVEIFEGGSTEVCISSSGILPEQVIGIDITSNLFNLFAEAPLAIPSALIFTSTNPRQCFNVILTFGVFGVVDAPVGTIEITISASPQNMDLVQITPDTFTINVIPGLIEGGEILVQFPGFVNVSEGNPVVVCFSADFSRIFSDEQSTEVILTLEIEDISTTPSDFQQDLIPPTLRLNMFTSIQCLRIPTFQNETEEEPDSELFSISISAVAQPFMPVRTTSSSTLVTIFEQCINGDIRLSEGNDMLQGRVQMCYDGVFGSVCDTGPWTVEDATVVCTQLGYPILLPEIEFHQDISIFGPVLGPIVPGNFACESFAPTLLNCSMDETLPAVCSPNAGVQCFANRLEGCTDGDLRLVGSNVTTRGRVEICYRNVWGTVCDDSWDTSDAAVVCRQLGLFSESLPIAFSAAEFGQGADPIWLDEVRCSGQETVLAECPGSPFGVNDCTHREDAGVDCGLPPVPTVPIPTTIATTQAATAVSTTEADTTMTTTVAETMATTEADTTIATTQAPVTSPIVPPEVCETEDTFIEFIALTWPTTQAGVTQSLSCPFSELGIITRRCSLEGVWLDPQTDNCIRRPCGPNEETCETEQGRCYSINNTCDGIPDCVINFQDPFSTFALDESQELCFQNNLCAVGELRPLIGGASPQEGVVEVCADGSQFLPVTLNDFSILEAGVVCRQLNLGTAGFPVSASSEFEIQENFFTNGVNGDFIFSAASITCSAGVQTISQCSIFIEEELDISALAGIQCIDVAQCIDGEMRLANAFGQVIEEVREGRVEFCYQGVWGAVYDTNWTAIDAAVTCQQLGFDPRGALPFLSAVFSSDPLPLVYDCPVCNTIVNTTLLDCPRETVGLLASPDPGALGQLTPRPSDVDIRSGIVGVSCEVYPDDGCNFLDVRLSFRERGGATGNLEVCSVANQWEFLCGNAFGLNELDVACRSLGFNDFGMSGQGNIFVPDIDFVNDDVGNRGFGEISCNGSEQHLSDCLIPQRKRRNTCEVSNPRITCQSRPEILFEPPIISGTLFVEEGRSAVIRCSVDNRFNHPDVTALASDMSSAFPILLKKREAPFFSEERFSTDVFVTDSARLNDSGVYNCTAFSGGSGQVFTISEGTVNTTRSFEVVVLGFSPGGVTQYLRFSALSRIRRSLLALEEVPPESTFIQIFEDNLLDSINSNIPGQQRVACQSVPRRQLDLNRGLDRYECVIFQSAGVEVDVDFSLVESAAAILERTSQIEIVSLNTSVSGFCDSDTTELQPLSDLPAEFVEAITLTWPETEVGTTVTLPCPALDTGSATRQCDSQGVWLEPNTTACEIVGLCGPGQFPCLTEGGRCIEDVYRCDGIPDCIQSFFPFEVFDEQECPNVCSESDVLPLVGGSTATEGLVEVCIGGKFTAIGLSTTTVLEANVICRQLGLGSAGFPIDFYLDLGNAAVVLESSLEFRTALINCSGMEQSTHLSDCVLSNENIPSDFLAIKCIDAAACSDGDVRLVSSSQETEGVREGRVEICYQGVWGAVHDPSWTAIDAAVTCQQLGFDPKGALPFVSAVYPTDPRLLPIVYDYPACTDIANTSSLLECPRMIGEDDSIVGHLGVLLDSFVGSLSLTNVVGVSCEDYPAGDCTELDVRLAYRDQGSATGNLEICFNNVWQSVCGPVVVDSFSVAAVACRALGFTDFESTEEEPKIVDPVVVDTGPIFANELTCSGIEQNLTDCGIDRRRKRGFSSFLCTHQEDLRFQCLARPQILLKPPVPTGVYEVDEGAITAELSCLVHNVFTHPDVTRIKTNTTAMPDEDLFSLDRRRRRGAPSPIEAQPTTFSDLYFPFVARAEDTGLYSCIATSEDVFPDYFYEYNYDDVASGGIQTIRSVNITVTAPTPGINEVAQYMRLSGISEQRHMELEIHLPPSEIDLLGQIGADVQVDVFNSINGFIPGQQRVTCEMVTRRAFDEQRGFDRYECVIFTSGVGGDSSLEPDVEDNSLSPAQAAAEVFQRAFSQQIISVSISDFGFCDFETLLFEGSLLEWPETEVGTTAILPCPTATNNVITRECDSDGVWLMPNAAGCSNCASDQFVCETEGGRCIDLSFRCDGVPDCIGSSFPFIAFDEQQCPSSVCADGDALELVGGSTPNEGFVEVCVNGTFLPVSLSNFSVAEAGVLCRQLGLGSAGFPFSSQTDLDLESGILFDGFEAQALVFCDGSEQSLSQCSLTSDTSLGNLVAVRCIDAAICSDGDVRLVSPTQETEGVREGRVEICYQGVWGAVYDTNWTAIDAAVTCQQLGFDPRGALPFLSAVFATDPKILPVIYDFPACEVDGGLRGQSNSSSLSDCPRQLLQETREGGNLGRLLFEEDAAVGVNALVGLVGVSCEDYTNTNCNELDVRLSYRERNGATGNVEVCFNNTWHEASSCFDFNQEEVEVVCRALGFNAFDGTTLSPSIIPPVPSTTEPSTTEPSTTEPSTTEPSTTEPSTTEPVFGSSLSCSGTESHLSECSENVRFKRINCVSFPTQFIRVECLARPEILFDPPVPSGVLTVSAGSLRPAELQCIVDNSNANPDVDMLISNGRVSFEPNRPTLLINGPSATIFTVVEPTVEDSGNYSCTASTFAVLDDFEFLQNVTIQTSRNIQVTVENLTLEVDNVVQQFIRLSVINIERIEEVSDLNFTVSQIEENIEFLVSTSIGVSGQQSVECQNVTRREFDIERGFDRYECVITTSAVTSEEGSAQTEEDLSIAEGTVAVLQRSLQNLFLSFSISALGFCDFDETTFEGTTTLFWPETAVGVTAIVPCPSGNATRQCSSAGLWLSADTTNCSGLADNINFLTSELTEENLDEQVEVFAVALSSAQTNPEQQTAQVLTAVADYFNRVSVLVGDIVDSDSDNSTISPALVSGLVQSLSSLQQWEPAVISETDDSSRIIMYFEFVVSQFAEQALTMFNVTEEGLTFVAQNLDLDDLVLNGKSITFGGINAFSPGNALEDAFVLPPGVLASVTLPPSLFDTIEGREFVGVFFALYEQSTLFPFRDLAQPSESTLHLAVASSIVAATVGPGLDFTDLDPPVEVNLRITNDFTDMNITVRNGSETCVSWDFAAADGAGNWTTEGCETVSVSDDGVVTCLCNHLTNFAILVDICTRFQDCETNPVVETILEVITYIGVVLSLVGLIITVVTLLAFRKLRQRDNSKYHIQLSIAIFCMLLVFVAGIDQTAVYGGCVTVSVLIHYFSLTAVMWMGAEAALMFHKLVFVFKKVTKKEIIVTSVVCWAAPLVPVLIPLIVDLATGTGPDSDLIVRRDQFCFLNNAIVFWVAFLGPIFAIIIFSTVVFVIVIIILIKHTRGSMARKNESLNSKTVIRLLVSIAGVMFLFGLSWLFGALTITVTAVRLTFSILFAIFTSLQGFFIFLFFCVFSKEARELWKETLSCGRYKSKFLNPHLKFTSTGAADKYRTPKNGASKGVASHYTSRSTQETVATFKPDLSTSTENIISQAESVDEHYVESPTKVDLGKERAAHALSSIADGDDHVAETNIDDISDSDQRVVEVDLETNGPLQQVQPEREVVAEEICIQFT